MYLRKTSLFIVCLLCSLLLLLANDAEACPRSSYKLFKVKAPDGHTVQCANICGKVTSGKIGKDKRFVSAKTLATKLHKLIAKAKGKLKRRKARIAYQTFKRKEKLENRICRQAGSPIPQPSPDPMPQPAPDLDALGDNTELPGPPPENSRCQKGGYELSKLPTGAAFKLQSGDRYSEEVDRTNPVHLRAEIRESTEDSRYLLEDIYLQCKGYVPLALLQFEIPYNEDLLNYRGYIWHEPKGFSMPHNWHLSYVFNEPSGHITTEKGIIKFNASSDVQKTPSLFPCASKLATFVFYKWGEENLLYQSYPAEKRKLCYPQDLSIRPLRWDTFSNPPFANTRDYREPMVIAGPRTRNISITGDVHLILNPSRTSGFKDSLLQPPHKTPAMHIPAHTPPDYDPDQDIPEAARCSTGGYRLDHLTRQTNISLFFSEPHQEWGDWVHPIDVRSEIIRAYDGQHLLQHVILECRKPVTTAALQFEVVLNTEKLKYEGLLFYNEKNFMTPLIEQRDGPGTAEAGVVKLSAWGALGVPRQTLNCGERLATFIYRIKNNQTPLCFPIDLTIRPARHQLTGKDENIVFSGIEPNMSATGRVSFTLQHWLDDTFRLSDPRIRSALDDVQIFNAW